MACNESWDIIMFAESHWQGGTRTVNIKGYNTYDVQRDATQKNGGGLVILINQRITLHLWTNKERVSNIDDVPKAN